MPFNGSGTYTLPYNWPNDAANNINITASRMQGQDQDQATALSDCVTRDGQSPWTANMPAGGFKITNLAVGSASNDSVTFGQALVVAGTNPMTGTLSLVAGTTTVEPLLFAAGTNLTAPVEGAVEFDGTHLYFTDSTPTRHTVAPQDSPVFTTPTLGVASATSINKLTLTAPATGSTLTLTDGKTFAVTNTLTLSGTDSTVMTFPSTSQTVVGLTATQSLTNKTLTSSTNTVGLPAIAEQADQTIVGNVSGGSASPVALTATQVRTMLNVSAATAAGQPQQGVYFTISGGVVTVQSKFPAAAGTFPTVVRNSQGNFTITLGTTALVMGGAHQSSSDTASNAYFISGKTAGPLSASGTYAVACRDFNNNAEDPTDITVFFY